MTTYRGISGMANELTATKNRPCYLSSSISPYKGLHSQTWAADAKGLCDADCVTSGGGASCYALCARGVQHPLGEEPYNEGHLGNRGHEFVDADGYTGLHKDTWGYGTNFYSELPYWYALVHSNPNLTTRG